MGRVIGVFSAKGGVGKSLIATNLGVAFRAGHKQRTAVIDLSPGLGTADLLLDLEPVHTWADLLPVIEELSPKHIQLAVTEFRPGLDVLACPPDVSWEPGLGAEGVSFLLSAFRKEYDVVVLDTVSGAGEIVKAAYDLVDLRIVVLTPDAPALRATGRYLDASRGKGEQVGLVINQHSPGAAVTPQEIQAHLDQQLLAVLPMDPKGVWANVSYGEPCVLRKNNSFGKSLRQLSTRLIKVMDQWAEGDQPLSE